MNRPSDCIWIAWEDHRRSRELAREFGATYIPMISNHGRPLRYLFLSIRTVIKLITRRPATVFCQNPSMILTALLCMLKSVFGYQLIVDRHSNFKPESRRSLKIKWRLFHYLSKYTVKKADTTIVTNKYLKRLCQKWGYDAVVLPDKLPKMETTAARLQPSFMMKNVHRHIMFVTMFDDDEPIEAMVSAKHGVPDSCFYFTGNYKKQYTEASRERLLLRNIILTGFISNEDYVALMQHCDIVVVMTTKEFILNCGAYEAVALNKPLVLSDTVTLRQYFGPVAVFAKPVEHEIYNAINISIANANELAYSVRQYKPVLESEWQRKWSMVVHKINNS